MGKSKPEYSLKAGAIRLSIWKNQTKKGVMQSITIDRSYKDGEEFKTTNSFRPADLPLIEVLMRKAMEYLFLKGESIVDVSALQNPLSGLSEEAPDF